MSPLAIMILIFGFSFAFILLLVKLITPSPEELAYKLMPFEAYMQAATNAKVKFTGEEIRDLAMDQPKHTVWSRDQMQTFLAVIEHCINHDKYFKYFSEEYISPQFRVKIEMDFYDKLLNKDTLLRHCCYCLNSGDGVFLIGIQGYRRNKKFSVEGYSRQFDEVMKNIPFMFTDQHREPIDLSDYFPSIKVYPLLGKEILALEVKQVPGHLKRIHYKGRSYYYDHDM